MRAQSVYKCLSFVLILSLLLVACDAAQEPAPTSEPVEETVAPTEAAAPTNTPVPEPTEVPKPKVLRVGTTAPAYVSDPEYPGRNSVGMFRVAVNVFEGLVRMDENFQLHPHLAESWEHDEARGVFTFHLRQGITFHDGQPFTADAVVESFNWRAMDFLGATLGIDETSTVAVDDYTVEIHTDFRGAALQLAHPYWTIRAPGWDPAGDEYVGTGPFRFVEWVDGAHITVEKNAHYWGEPAKVDRVEFYFIPDANTRVLALQAGEVDLIYEVPTESVVMLEETEGIKIMHTPVSRYQAMGMLISGEEPYDILRDIKVREAIGYAIDRSKLIEVAHDGHATEDQTLVPAKLLGEHASLVEGYVFDPGRAEALLEEAGWVDTDGDGIREKDGRKLTLELVNGFPSPAELGIAAEVLQGQLAEVGIEVKIVTVADGNAYWDRSYTKQGDLWLEMGSQNSPSPCFLPNFLYYGADEPNAFQGALSPKFAGFPEINDEIDGCMAAADPAEAARWAAEAIHTVVDEARTVTVLAGIYRQWAMREEVEGFIPYGVSLFVRWDTVSIP